MIIRKFMACLVLCATIGSLWISMPAHAEDRQVSCLAETIFREARGRDLAEKIRIGSVVMNRTHNKHFANTPCAVLYQKGQFPWVTRFSPKERQATIRFDHNEYDNCLGIARNIYNGSIKDNTHGALFFHANDGKRRTWNKGLVLLFKTKAHIYYTFPPNKSA